MPTTKEAKLDGPSPAHGFSLPGTLTFATLRSADFFLQTSLLRHFSPATAPFSTAHLSFLGLTPYYSCIAAMVATASLRHVFWVAYLNEQRMEPAFARMVSALFVMGSFIETFAEVQRKRFKRRPEAKGKAFMAGLFGSARHVNYGGYLLWRTGWALFAGGLPWAAVVAGYFLFYFLRVVIPALDVYCSQRYGEQWAEFKRRLPYKILPGIL